MAAGAYERRDSHAVLPLDKPTAGRPDDTPPASASALDALEADLATDDGAEDAVLLASTAGALACLVLTLLRPGDHVVAADGLDDASLAFLAQELPVLGMTATCLAADAPRGWRRAMQGTTRALLVPCPEHAQAGEAALHAPRLLAREAGVVLVALVTPGGGRPLAQGADAVIRTLTAAGTHGAPAAVCAPQPLCEELRLRARRWGLAPSAALVEAVAARRPSLGAGG